MIDSHAHLFSLEGDLPAILTRAKEAGLKSIVNIATNPDEMEKGIKLAKEQSWIFNAAATTPHDVEKEGERDFAAIEKRALEGLLIAVGETGLDYHYEHSKKEVQKQFLLRYLDLAKRAKLPVIFHCREAFNDLFDLVDEKRALLHCFTGTIDEAQEVVSRGWYLSLSGIVTFKKSEALREVAKMVPLNQLLIETDAPYLAPQSKRGLQNEPAFIVETAKVIAQTRGIAVEELIKATAENAQRFFNL